MSKESTPAVQPPTNRYAVTAVEKQRNQLEKLLRDPSKPAYVPLPPKEKTIRPPREMMKNVQGSSAGAGSGEFHVYKASRRREYERLKLLEEQAQNETTTTEFEQKRKQLEEIAEAKTAKNRAKRQKKKQRSKKGGSRDNQQPLDDADVPFKKRRVVNGKELVFRHQGDDSSEEEELKDPNQTLASPPLNITSADAPDDFARTVDLPKITFHEE